MAAGKKGLDLALLISKRITSSSGFDRVLNKVINNSNWPFKLTSKNRTYKNQELSLDREVPKPGSVINSVQLFQKLLFPLFYCFFFY